MAIEVKAVKTAGERRAFLNLVGPLYAGDRSYVPPLGKTLRRALAPAFSPDPDSPGRAFLGLLDGRPAGRIAVFIDPRYLELHRRRSAFFGLFECPPNPDLARALFGRAKGWAAQRGLELIEGPYNPFNNDLGGFLTQGFDDPPVFLMPYNPPYYPDLARSSGLEEVKTMVSYSLKAGQVEQEVWENRLRRLRARNPGLKVRNGRMEDWEEEVATILEIYNRAWEGSWAFVPFTRAEAGRVARELRPIVVPELVKITELEGRPVGMVVAILDYNQALKGLNGGKRPWVWLTMRRRIKRIDRARVFLNGVLPEHRHLGVMPLQVNEMVKTLLDRGLKSAEMGKIAEDNLLSRKIIERLGGKVVKKFVAFGGEVG